MSIRRPVTAALSVLLVASMVTAAQTNTAAAAKPVPNDVLHGSPSPVRDVSNPKAHKEAMKGTPQVRWPEPGARALNADAGVDVLDRAATDKAGVRGVLLKVQPANTLTRAATVPVSVDYSGFRDAYGGDWATRLRLVQLPECVLTTPDRPECQTREVLPTRNDTNANRLSAHAAPGSVLAAEAGQSGAAGDLTATSLAPSASWNVSTQSGDYTVSYPFRMPEVPGNLTPKLTASYSTNSVDGHTASTNNQPSLLGEGWDLSIGSIERRYKSCADDMQGGSPKTADRCWANLNASLSLGSIAGDVVFDNDGNVGKLAKDDGTKVERLQGAANGDEGGSWDKGEYWKVTTRDGVQYFFGSRPEAESTLLAPVFGNNAKEPCSTGNFDTSSCKQAYRWNLDQVVDPHGNAVRYYYKKENNKYGLNLNKSAAEYTRDSYPDHIDYGIRASDANSVTPAARVSFAMADRCAPGANCAQHVEGSWPDVPWDQECTGSTCPDRIGPSFWSTKRLASITTQVFPGGTARNVERWTFDQEYPATGDSTRPALWLNSITQTGLADSTEITNPPMRFERGMLSNRVNRVDDGLPPMRKARIIGLFTEAGGHISVNYDGHDCDPAAFPAPESNTKRCFPVRWAPDKAGPITDWFTRYIVTSTVSEDPIGKAAKEVTTFTYDKKGGAWAYNNDPLTPADARTWSRWRGYEKVIERSGDPAQEPEGSLSETEYLYFRGMHGDRKTPAGGTRSVQVTDSRGGSLDDQEPLVGFLREKTTRNGKDGPVVAHTITTPKVIGPTLAQGELKAFRVDSEKESSRTALSAGGWRETEVDTAYDEHGNAEKTNDVGDLATPDDDKCVRTTYAKNVGANMLGLPSRVETVGVACGTTAVYPKDTISDVVSYYDGKPLGETTKGDVTSIKSLTGYANGAPTYEVTSRVEPDQYGRVLKSYDVDDNLTTTNYTPTSGVATSGTVTDPKGFPVTTTYDPVWGKPASIVDANNHRTKVVYDALGRTSKVYLPGHDPDNGDSPDTRYDYLLRNNGATAVTTETLKANGNTVRSYALYDGFMRARQTQAPAWGGGRVVTDVYYDSRGQKAKANGAYAEAGNPGVDLVTVPDGQVPSQTVTTFDGAGRPVLQKFLSKGQFKWQTKTDHAGDSVSLTPPSGGTAQTTIADARGQTTELRKYHGPAPTGGYDATKYTYAPGGQIKSVTDPAGNVWTYEYDVQGREKSRTDPDKGITTTTYTKVGKPETMKDGRGQVLVNVFDSLGRKTELRKDSKTGPLLASWSFDTLPNGKGKASGNIRYQGGQEYVSAVLGYDQATGQETGTRVVLPQREGKLAGTYETRNDYMPDGSVKSITMPLMGDLSQETVNFFYDDYGLPSYTKGISDYVVSSGYTAFGETYQLRHGTTKSVWNTLYRDQATRNLTRSLITREKEDGVVVNNTDYEYDPAGNTTMVADRVGGQTQVDRQCYRYDSFRRLTQAWTVSTATCGEPGGSVGGPAPYWTSYTHDPAGNRKTETKHGLAGSADTLRTYNYPAPKPNEVQTRPHAVQSITTGTRTDEYKYGAIGESTQRPGQTLTWNPEGDIDTITTGTTTSNYVYDANGALLVIGTSDGDRTLYLGHTWLKSDKAGTLTATRYYTHGKDTVAARTAGGLRYLFGDQKDTDTITVDAKDLAVTKRRLDPFGNPREAASTPWPNNRGFVGGIQDGSTGLTRLGVRNYDPALGQFISTDPLLDTNDPQSFNAYGYGANNPVAFSDANGKGIPECYVDWTICAGAGVNPITGQMSSGPLLQNQQQSLERHGYPPNGCGGSCLGWNKSLWPKNRQGTTISPSKCAMFGNCHLYGPAALSREKQDLVKQERESTRILAVRLALNLGDDFEFAGSGSCGAFSYGVVGGGGYSICEMDDGTFLDTAVGGLGVGTTMSATTVYTFKRKGSPTPTTSVSTSWGKYINLASGFKLGRQTTTASYSDDGNSISASVGFSVNYKPKKIDSSRKYPQFNVAPEGGRSFSMRHTNEGPTSGYGVTSWKTGGTPHEIRNQR